MVKLHQQAGYVALIAVLVVGAAALTISLLLLTTGADSSRYVLVEQQAVQARSLSSSCAEEALQKLYEAPTYAGTGNLSLGQGTCTYTVTNTGATTRTIDTTATVNSVVRKTKVYVTISSSSISITSWQEVSDA